MKDPGLIKYGEAPQPGLGEKANNLLKLVRQNFNVPPFLVIPQQWFESFFKSNKDVVLNRESIMSAVIPEELLHKIRSSFSKDIRYFAVRSSYALEDSEDQSFAGQFTSRLFVRSDQLGPAILEVWSSCLNERALTYQMLADLDAGHYMSVIIQEMIDAEVSGVAFSMNPVTGHRSQHVINSVFGLGEGLVSGDLTADQFLIYNGQITSSLAQKTHFYRLDSESGSGIIKSLASQDQVSKSSMDDEKLMMLYRNVNQLKSKFHSHVDVEFAWKNNALYLLQVRPVTTYRHLPDEGGKYIVWDNSNIIESYPGITLPLTFSYIIDLYERAYIQFIKVLGVSDDEIERSKLYFSNMLGLLNGRVYYNLRSWYKMISMLPGYRFNARFMEQMMGVKERFDLDDYVKISKFSDLYRIVRMFINILVNLVTLEKQKRKFMKAFNRMEAEYLGIDPDSLSLDEIMDEYLKREALILKIWKAPLLNDFYAMIFFGLVKKQLTGLFGTDSSLHNDLFIGDQTIVTTQPARMISDMVNMIYASDQLMELFKSQDPLHIYNQLQNTEDFHSLKDPFNSYVDSFGDRVVGELKLETISYKQEPERLVSVLLSYISNNKQPNAFSQSQTQNERITAEKKIKEKLKFKPLKRLIFFLVLRKARKLVSGRENLRLYRTKAFGGAREAFLKMGELLALDGKLEQQRDIFYLRKEEIFRFIAGTSVNPDLKAVVAQRKKSFDEFEQESVQSERLRTYGAVPVGNSFYQESQISSDTGDMKGTGCCKGYVKGPVHIIEKPSDAYGIDGGILVTSSTDPGWVTIFPSISGILVERGSLLSHVAIVAREMGIPCIVALNGITKRLKNGTIVEMDGSLGTVNILETIEEEDHK